MIRRLLHFLIYNNKLWKYFSMPEVIITTITRVVVCVPILNIIRKFSTHWIWSCYNEKQHQLESRVSEQNASRDWLSINLYIIRAMRRCNIIAEIKGMNSVNSVKNKIICNFTQMKRIISLFACYTKVLLFVWRKSQEKCDTHTSFDISNKRW